MQPEPVISNISHVIQLSVAPVFLLTGVGSILSVLINRLGRIVDRIRVVDQKLIASARDDKASLRFELTTLGRRMRLINWAISLCITCALLVCLVIAMLFVSFFINMNVSYAAAILFVVAMLALIGGLLSFLREIYLAIAIARMGMH
ncbi:DUF2721 domain-containing protein [Geobacter hydrogenophilus]|uniref:DUF2721 domain-containing protein n=1 Tax=Geobacter hydrogenophilus TaxID=40983 RepID=A0A9W6LE58_9BACT|nr:DUF2721 domain-containing protein [Geobacter hydrogenophilus]MBT0892999.1 DUF2721 domain-containing protein [Geobacter hydrogenophilus]GLI39166.1 hypothetical protein GHYDROH2_26670 [Geobacter hydrogenophilus]